MVLDSLAAAERALRHGWTTLGTGEFAVLGALLALLIAATVVFDVTVPVAGSRPSAVRHRSTTYGEWFVVAGCAVLIAHCLHLL